MVLYYAVLALWPLLLWPAWRFGGWRRVWFIAVAAAGALAAGYEWHIQSGPIPSIRLDIPLIAITLVILYASAAAVLYASHWRRLAAVLGLAVVLIAGGIGYVWYLARQEAARLDMVFETRNALLFAAKFRSPAAYDRYFATAGEATDPALPVGHWLARPGGYFSRLVINPAGRAWAFFGCGQTECDYRSVGALEPVVGSAAGTHWQVALKPPVGAAVPVRIARTSAGDLRLEGQGQPTTFAPAPPPVAPHPAPAVLRYLGPFVDVACHGQHADIRQLWLWQQDTRLFAVGIIATLVAGRHAGFVSPTVLGAQAAAGDAWTFAWQQHGQDWRARVTIDGERVALAVHRGDAPASELTLRPGAIFRDEAIELAPLSGAPDWQHWFDIVLTDHFAGADIPAC